jgi:hypothetical protein
VGLAELRWRSIFDGVCQAEDPLSFDGYFGAGCEIDAERCKPCWDTIASRGLGLRKNLFGQACGVHRSWRLTHGLLFQHSVILVLNDDRFVGRWGCRDITGQLDALLNKEV